MNRISEKKQYFNLDADSSTSVAHGVTSTNILAVSVVCFDDNLSVFRVSESYFSEQPSIQRFVNYDATNIIITNVGIALQGNAYRIRMDYTI